jgi:glycosyltransferase involved in cell wall biosynthesis
MHLTTHPLLQTLSWLLALTWLYKFLEAAFGFPRVPNLLDAAYDRTPLNLPSLTIIVPARNEAANIAACLQSLLAQDYPNLHILAVNDRSSDTTGTILDSLKADTLAAAHPTRLTALHITELPANWLGKTHAMALAAHQTIATHAPDYLLFTDADIHFAPTILRRALAQVVATQADHFVVLPTTLAKSPGEAMLLSFFQVISLWAVRPWRADTPGRRDAVGVGAFNLIRTSAYLQLGGFDAIPMEIVEDLTLGRRVKAAGLRQRVAFAPGAVSVHWASGIFGIVNGLTKNMFAVFKFRPERLLIAAAAFGIACLTPFVLMATPGMRAQGFLAFAAIAGIYVLFSRVNRISPWYAALFPLSATLIVYSMLRSMFVTLKNGGVEWRGTFYPLATLKRQPRIDADHHG